MTLPAPNSAWPPAIVAEPRRYLATARTWYQGDTEGLVRHYSTSKPAGGKVGFWSKVRAAVTGRPSERPNSPAKPDDRGLHVPLATDLAVAYSRMLTNEALEYSWGDEVADVIPERWSTIAKGCSWESRLTESAEKCAGLGDIYLLATWDTTIVPHAIITSIDPARVIPTFKRGHLVEATLVDEYAGVGQEVWRHLEHHERGRVIHALYKGTPSNLGRLMALDDHESTRDLVASVDEFGSIETGYDGLAVVHIPAMRPNRALSGHPLADDLGRAVTAGLEGLLDRLDQAWTSLMWDLEAAKTRLFVAQHLLNSPDGATLQTERGVYPVMHQPGENESGLPIKADQALIRFEEHLAIIEGLVRQVITSAGFSPQTFGLSDGASGETATGVHARTSLTRETREAATRYLQGPIETIIEAALAIDARHCGGPGVARPDVSFPQFAAPTLLEIAQTIQALFAASAISIETGVRLAHPDWDDERVTAEVNRILAQSGMAVPDFEQV